ncbi:unnamed protein product [Spirodela intermedia]|uniref:Uncharacterized protein n=2 Tax=Spirodela intermedia TaxID=51605 RepID=A0ABN7EB28_SPIIN|nr:unnamed protein product [Spirodela intermedia]CAA7403318.1 unnamed protein product [Spirodela intermedia]
MEIELYGPTDRSSRRPGPARRSVRTVDLLLAAPWEEIHDRCLMLSPSEGKGGKSWPAYGVQAAPREKGRGGRL